jgi:hypothetical protein
MTADPSEHPRAAPAEDEPLNHTSRWPGSLLAQQRPRTEQRLARRASKRRER